MKKLTYFTITILFFISCSNNTNTSIESESHLQSEDSLKSIIQENETIIAELLEEKTSLLSSLQKDNSKSNKSELYGEIIPSKISNYDMIEVMNLVDTSFSFYCKPKDITVSIYRCGNGPSDPNKDYCNGSFNLYIATAQHEFPPTYNLYEVGPFVDLKIDSINSNLSRIFISYDDKKGKVKSKIIEVSLNKIKI